MNSEVYKLNKTSKKRSHIEQLLLVDHSDIYFENDKLGDKLNRFRLQLRKDHHKSVILRDTEIKDLNKELENFKVILKTSENDRNLREVDKPPDTPINKNNNIKSGISDIDNQFHFRRHLRALTPDADFKYSEEKHKVRIKSSLEIFQEEPINVPVSRSVSPASERGNDKFLGPRSQTRVSGLRRLRKVREHIDTSDFPQEWFTTVVPASDAVFARVRRHKSAPLHQQLKMQRSRKKKPIEKEEKEETNMENNKTEVNNDNNESEETTGLRIICETPVKPVVMSLRQLKEIANIDNIAEKVPNKYETLMKERIERTKTQYDELETRCKTFVEMIKSKTEKDIEDEGRRVKKDTSEDDMYSGVKPPS